MSDKDPKSDLNYRGIGTLSYSEVLDEIEDNKKTFLRSTLSFLLNAIILFVIGYLEYSYWQIYQSIVFGVVIGFLLFTYVLAVLLYFESKKKFELRLGELE